MQANVSDLDRQKVSEIFHRADVHKTGLLELHELRTILTSLDPSTKWTDALVRSILEEADLNFDGGIDFDEFLHWAFSDAQGRELCLKKPSRSAPKAQAKGSAARSTFHAAHAATKAAPASQRLTPSMVFVRVRPVSSTGDCGHTEGEAVSKKVAHWDEKSVTVQDDDRGETRTFAVTRIIPPEWDQVQTFGTIAPELLEAFTSDVNVLFFAYGQTGTGKTHTMLGEVESLASPVPTAGWGIFPRVVHSSLETMKRWRAEGIYSVLLASAVEFYCGVGFDLNSDPQGKTEITIDREANIFGTRSKEIRSTRQLRKWIMRMYANRTTAKTKMNDASSRSHCAFILTLHQLRADNTYLKTTFSIVDMAGSERHSKTGGKRVTENEARKEIAEHMEAGTPERISIGCQGFLINAELSFLATEILKASEQHKKGMAFKAAKEFSTAASFYFSACCDGRALLGACVSITQSPQHGFESWFSLRYAEQLAACRVPLSKVVAVPMEKMLQDATVAAEEAAERFARWGDSPNPQGAKQYRVFCLQSGAATHTAETLEYLHKLADQRDGTAPEEEEEEDDANNSDGEWPPPPPTQPKRFHPRDLKKSALELGRCNENFSVFIRVRPLLEREKAAGATNCFAISDIDFPRDPPPQRITLNNSDGRAKNSYVFDRVFDESYGQEAIYQATAQRYVAGFLDGTNVTIFAYGQTGTGKTHTITGPSEDPGFVNRCLSDVFARLPATGKEVYYEYVQIYMNEIKDLLVEEQRRNELKLVERKDGCVFVHNVTSLKAVSATTVLQSLEAGAKRRATRGHDMNEASSRSHAVLMLRLVEPREDPSNAIASMFIVDLAGSERIGRSGVTGQGAEEASAINASLTSLGRVVVTLLENQSSGGSFVPYNGHPLTMILKAGLGGNSKTALIACVTQATDSMGESENTLRFAVTASHVKNKVEKKEARDKDDKAAEKLESAGHSLAFDPSGKGIVGGLRCGDVEVWGDFSAGPERPLVVILVGFGQNPGEWAPLCAELQAARLRWLAPYFKGKGCSGHPEEIIKGSGSDIVIELLDWLGVRKVHVVGIDWGALVTITLLAKHGKRIGKYALICQVLKTENGMSGGLQGDIMRDSACWWAFMNDATLKATCVKLRKSPAYFFYPSKTIRGARITGPLKSTIEGAAKALKAQQTDNAELDSAAMGQQIAAKFS
eukprot:TRINITY_DN7844_c0_g1_i4.p1 TRINITY_DN7844_c0_g1~~TRINITY_DN7844_c0_g1_i4.p1  ORF type:complete len:1190 (+),score=219.62 TRINITY_DN7844_c0_g1_i4:74-3643(+)